MVTTIQAFRAANGSIPTPASNNVSVAIMVATTHVPNVAPKAPYIDKWSWSRSMVSTVIIIGTLNIATSPAYFAV